MKKTSKNKSLPAKAEERSRTAQAADVDTSQPPELAKSFTSSEARTVIEMNLRPIQVAVLRTRIVGLESLITHRWSEKALKEMLSAQQMTKEEKKLAKQKRAHKDPKAEFQGARYNWDGKDFFPVTGIKKSMVTAGYALGIARSIIQRSVFVRGTSLRDYAEIKARKVQMREDPVRVGPFNNRTADLRYRPEYLDWSAELIVDYRSDVITAEQVVTLLQNAGFSVGIGEWRPERDGHHGRFEVEAAPKKRAAPARKGARRAA